MQRHHTGSGRRRAVPATWGADHAAVAAGTRNAVVSIAHSASPASSDDWDEDTEVTTAAVRQPYAEQISARIQALARRSDQPVDVAEEELTDVQYLVAVDRDLVPAERDVVTVTSCNGDLLLAGRTLRIDQVLGGSERFERDLLCTLLDLHPST